MFFILLLLLASPISVSSKSLALYKQYKLPTGANPLAGKRHLHDFAFFHRCKDFSSLEQGEVWGEAAVGNWVLSSVR